MDRWRSAASSENENKRHCKRSEAEVVVNVHGDILTADASKMNTELARYCQVHQHIDFLIARNFLRSRNDCLYPHQNIGTLVAF